MNRIVIIFCFLSFQVFGQQKQRYKVDDLMGEWIGIKTNENAYPIGGFTLGKNNVLEYKLGFFKTVEGKRQFIGTRSKYKLEGDKLLSFIPGTNLWETYTILGLHEKHLRISDKKHVFDFSRVNDLTPPQLEFDRIIVSTSGSLGTSPISNTIINSNGIVIFEGIYETGKIGLFTGEITRDKYLELQAGFSKLNINNLATWYRGTVTDAQTISVTFVKNGKIFKTIADYDYAAPYIFKGAYVQVMYLYQNLPLKAIQYPKFLENVYLKFQAGDKILDIRQSELFLLKEALRKGKIVKKNFVKRFRFQYYIPDTNLHVDLYTDGRYFQLLHNGKHVIIDIGFNFFDFNSHRWKWKMDYGIESMYH